MEEKIVYKKVSELKGNLNNPCKNKDCLELYKEYNDMEKTIY